MQSDLALDYAIVAGFFIIGVAFVMLTLGMSSLLQHKERTEAKYSTYECGREPVGPAWIQFRIGYYVYALLFVIFDIETIFLYPWAVAFGTLGTFILLEMVLFLLVLGVGLAYAWKEGALQWR
jgi:NADH-quinone oxidoreductase subunit A